MDYSFLDDPDAIDEILATAEPEHRAMQSARRWDDKTLAIEIVRIRYKNEEEEWEERVLRMSDEELTEEVKSMNRDVQRYMHCPTTDSVLVTRNLRKLKHFKKRRDFIKKKQEPRQAKKKFTERIQRMSDPVLSTEVTHLQAQQKKLLDDFETARKDETNLLRWQELSQVFGERLEIVCAEFERRKAPKLSASTSNLGAPVKRLS